MCGIVGYNGGKQAAEVLVNGLKKLEYRGYDSAGIAVFENGRVKVEKAKGRLANLEERLTQNGTPVGCVGIGHTRWATHGAPSDINSHPHLSDSGTIAVVHNGIIENYQDLKNELGAKGVTFLSETDTEAAAATLNEEYAKDSNPAEAIRRAVARMKGSYAFGILFEDHPGEVWAVRSGSPLILARGEDGFYLASDMTALLPFTKEYHYLAEGQLAHLTPTDATLYLANGTTESPAWSVTTMSPEAAQKGGYPHFMLKEMYEEPEALVKSVSPRIVNGLPDFSADGIDASFWTKIKNIQIVACGSAMHAGIVGGQIIEDLAGIPTTAYIASEFRYRPPLAVDGTLVLLISQSGETADTLAALRYAKSKGLPTLAIVNAVETTIAREADYRIYTYAGPEIAVATTKGYCTQASVLYLIATAMAHTLGKIDNTKAAEIVSSLMVDAPAAMSAMLDKIDTLRDMAAKICHREHIFYIGRGLDYALSLEAALKLKEISYIHCESYAAGELKHGTISLIEEGTPVIAISTEEALYDKTESNVREVQSRGAKVIMICREDAKNPQASAEDVILLPTTSQAATLFAALATVQILAYETALLLGCDIDRPRNLAKSVTVE